MSPAVVRFQRFLDYGSDVRSATGSLNTALEEYVKQDLLQRGLARVDKERHDILEAYSRYANDFLTTYLKQHDCYVPQPSTFHGYREYGVDLLVHSGLVNVVSVTAGLFVTYNVTVITEQVTILERHNDYFWVVKGDKSAELQRAEELSDVLRLHPSDLRVSHYKRIWHKEWQ